MRHCLFAEPLVTTDLSMDTVRNPPTKYQAFNLKHQYFDAWQFCQCRNQQLLPFDIGSKENTKKRLDTLGEKFVKSGKLHDCDINEGNCDLAFWLPFRENSQSKWEYGYFPEIKRETSDIGWSRCDPSVGLNRHQDQPFGENQHCLGSSSKKS